MRTLLLLLLLLFSGCQVIPQHQSDSFSEKLLDEDRLVTVLTSEIDARKDEAIESVGKEAERVGAAIAEKVNQEIVQPALEDMDHKIDRVLDRQSSMAAEYAEALEAAHAKFLRRLPWYAIFLIILIWGASVIDDLFRALFGKKSKWREPK